MARRSRYRGFVGAFIDDLQRSGRITFVEADLRAHSPQSRRAVLAALWRLERSGRVIRPMPKSDFFVIVPHEYYSFGAPPSAWYLDALFKHLELPYYIGLLSAAQWHGATHFPAQETQVVTSRQLRPISVGRESIRFIVKRAAAETAVEIRRTEQAEIRVSTPEATALDLIRYVSVAGGLNAVATVLSELMPHLNARAFGAALERDATPVDAQRLGYVFESLSAPHLVKPLYAWLQTKRVREHVLDPDGPGHEGNYADRWHLRVNAPIEPTL